MNDLNIVIPITKADESRHEIYGVMTAEVEDKSGEILDYEGAKPEIQRWSDEISRISQGKSKGNLRRQHNAEEVVGKVLDIVFNDDLKQVECRAKVTDEKTFSDILEGVISGFSIGGSYVKKWVDESGMKRYIPHMIELSVVDSPCVGSAVIEYVKADGSIEMKTFHKEGKNMDEMQKANALEELQKTDETVMQNFKEALAKADTKKAFSFEEITNRLMGALKAQITTPFNAGYFWIKKTYADSVIICGDLDGDGDKDCYRVGYSMDADGVITLGKIEAVRAVWIPAIDEDSPAQEFGLPKAHKADEASDLQKTEESSELEKTSVKIDEKQEDEAKDEVKEDDKKDSEEEEKAEKANESSDIEKAEKVDIFEQCSKAMDNDEDETLPEKCGKLFHKMVEKGLHCKCDKCAKVVEEEKAEKADSCDDLHKAAEPMEKADYSEQLSKAMSVIEDLKKGFDTLKSDNEALKKTVEKLKNEPIPGGAMIAHGTLVAEKTVMGEGAVAKNESDMLRKMFEDEKDPVIKQAMSERLAKEEMKKMFS